MKIAKVILDTFEQIQNKYEQGMMASMMNANDSSYYYKAGVVDGINHCWKVIMGEADDYLDGVK